MRPVNTSNVSSLLGKCQETPSTCVTWDGPDITCLGVEICKGQSINPLLFEIFKQLCIALEKIDISGLNTACLFNLPSEPENINDLLNLIIDTICNDNLRLVPLQDISTVSYSASLPYCLQSVSDAITVTKLPIEQYIPKVGVKICEELSNISVLESTINDIETNELPDLNAAVQAACAPIDDIKVTPLCAGPPVPTLLVNALENLEAIFCNYKNFTGSVVELQNAIALECHNLGNLQALSGNMLMRNIYGWIETPYTVADTINNLWLTICDIRSAIRNILIGCCEFSPCLSFNVFYELVFDTNNPPQYFDIVFNDGVYPPPSPMPGLNGSQTTIKSLDRLSTYLGSGAPPAWINTDFPFIGNVILTINDGSGDIVIDTGNTIVQFMEFPGLLNGQYRFNYPPDYDYTASVKTIKIEFDYKWDNPVTAPFNPNASCKACKCCCTYSITNGIY